MKLLDLFCGAGGAAMGYRRAGFEVVGVDNKPQPRYPFEFIQAEWDEVLAYLPGLWEHNGEPYAIHASPPCQRYSTMTKKWGREETHPDLVAPTRARLLEIGAPFVIENVPGAPLVDPVTLCGSMFNLRLSQDYVCSCGEYFPESLEKYGCPNCEGQREVSLDVVRQLRKHRLFETSFVLSEMSCQHEGRAVPVYGNVGGSSRRDPHLRFFKTDAWREVMGIDWMTGADLREAIPPAYTEWIGQQLMEAVVAQTQGPRDASKRVSYP